jgi:hypothetical protein
MGNCLTIENDGYLECVLCRCELNVKYIYCAYCNKRFHYHCLCKDVPNLDHCVKCKTPNLRFVNTRIESQGEGSFDSISLKSKRYTI